MTFLMGKQNKTEQLKKAAVQALYENKGNVSVACSAVSIGRTQFYQWKKEDEDFANAVDNVVEFAIDHVESALHRRIDDGDTTAIIFYLKTIGKRRGYVERTEMDHSGQINTPLSDAQVEKLINAVTSH